MLKFVICGVAVVAINFLFYRKLDEYIEVKIRENGAVPVLYATWAYQKDGKQLQKFGIDYDEMYRKMHEAYAEAAEKNHTLLADVGSAFYEKTETENLFNDDGSHPNEAGSNLAAETIAEVILKDSNA